MPRAESGETPSLQLRTELVEAAHAVLDGRMGVLEGARKIDDLRARHPYPDLMLFEPFVSVSSESDSYPLGDVRQHWNPDALAELDRRAEAYAAAVRDGILSACRGILRSYDRLVPRERRSSFSRAVAKALMEEWDPIGVRDIPEAENEYSAYVGSIALIVDMRGTHRTIFDHLWEIETGHMGLTGDRAATERFADSLIRLRDSFVAPAG